MEEFGDEEVSRQFQIGLKLKEYLFFVIESHPSLYPFGRVTCVPRYGASNPNIPASPSRLGTAGTKNAGSSLCCLVLECSGRSQAFRLVREGCKLHFPSERKLKVFSFFPAVARIQELELQEMQ